jgi:hypothetical protein
MNKSHPRCTIYYEAYLDIHSISFLGRKDRVQSSDPFRSSRRSTESPPATLTCRESPSHSLKEWNFGICFTLVLFVLWGSLGIVDGISIKFLLNLFLVILGHIHNVIRIISILCCRCRAGFVRAAGWRRNENAHGQLCHGSIVNP